MTKKVFRDNSQFKGKSSSSEIGQTGPNLTGELAKEIPQEFWNQITGSVSTKNKSGLEEIYPGQTVNLNKTEPVKEEQEQFNQSYQRKIEFQRRINLNEINQRLNESQEIAAKINLIRDEISLIVANMTQISQQVAEIKVSTQENIPQPGKYHLSFLELLLGFLYDLRERVEEGCTWLAAFQKKEQKRGYFWGQVKKSGTKFLLSSDRTPATQTG